MTITEKMNDATFYNTCLLSKIEMGLQDVITTIEVGFIKSTSVL
jgi:hypothetical protein